MLTTTTYPEFKPGQKVRTCYGDNCTVLFQNGCQVFVEEECNGWYHPTEVGGAAREQSTEHPGLPANFVLLQHHAGAGHGGIGADHLPRCQ